MAPICTLVVCGAPLAARAPDVAAELIRAGWELRVVLTPAAEQWVDRQALEAVTGSSGQTQQRASDSPKPPRPQAIAVVPITFNSVGKAANGIADTLAHSAMAEALGEGLPFVAVSMVNQYLAGNPAWAQNTKHLTAAGVTWVSVVDGTVGDARPVQSGRVPRWSRRSIPRGSRGSCRRRRRTDRTRTFVLVALPYGVLIPFCLSLFTSAYAGT